MIRVLWSKLRAYFGAASGAERRALPKRMVEEEPAKGLPLEWALWVWVDQCRQDVAYGCSTLRKSLGFTLAAGAVLALGTGANLTTFQMFLVSILQKPAVRDADALVRLEPVS